jgi:hypothetical protein
MLLNIKGYELEIVQGKFVCLDQNDGETCHFCEWRRLHPELQEKFKAMREELMGLMEKFINSKDKTSFEAVSEECKKDQPDCAVPKA